MRRQSKAYDRGAPNRKLTRIEWRTQCGSRQRAGQMVLRQPEMESTPIPRRLKAFLRRQGLVLDMSLLITAH